MRVNWTVLNPLHWKRTFLMGVLGGFVVLWIGFLDTYSLWARYTLSRERADLIRRTEELTRRSEELSRKITELQRDPALLERIAREEYGMRRPGETVYRFRKP